MGPLLFPLPVHCAFSLPRVSIVQGAALPRILKYPHPDKWAYHHSIDQINATTNHSPVGAIRVHPLHKFRGNGTFLFPCTFSKSQDTRTSWVTIAFFFTEILSSRTQDICDLILSWRPYCLHWAYLLHPFNRIQRTLLLSLKIDNEQLKWIWEKEFEEVLASSSSCETEHPSLVSWL